MYMYEKGGIEAGQQVKVPKDVILAKGESRNKAVSPLHNAEENPATKDKVAEEAIDERNEEKVQEEAEEEDADDNE